MSNTNQQNTPGSGSDAPPCSDYYIRFGPEWEKEIMKTPKKFIIGMLRKALRDKPSAINIVFDGYPGPKSGRFVEVENDDGQSIDAGEWVKRSDGLWALRIKSIQTDHHQQTLSGGSDHLIVR